LGCLAGEIVSGRLGSSDALVDANVSSEDGAEDAVLEAAWVAEVKIQLAVLAGLDDGNAGADGCNVGIEDEGEGLTISRDERANGALRTSSSSICKSVEVDLVCWGVDSCRRYGSSHRGKGHNEEVSKHLGENV